jgi:hypothetical protein
MPAVTNTLRVQWQRQRQVKGVRMHNLIRRHYRRLRMLGASLVAVLLATSLSAGAASAATGGLPGTGDKSFNPAANSEGTFA